MLNTHNIKMIGIRKAAGETKGLGGYYSGDYVELFYDRSTGEVWTCYQYSLGQNTCTQYHDDSIIKIGNLSEPTSMQQIADLISCRLDEIAAEEANYREWRKEYA